MLRRSLYVLGLWLTLGVTLSAQRTLRYWFDDQYEAQRTLPSTASVGQLSKYDIPTADLSAGLHTLYLQIRGADGLLSPVRSSLFLKAKAPLSSASGREKLHYWIDDIASKGKPISIAPDSEGIVDMDLPLGSVPTGLHTLYLQWEDEGGYVSPVRSFLFVKPHILPSSTGKPTIHYWYDDIRSKHYKLPPLSQESGVFDLTLSTADLKAGLHTLYLQYQAKGGEVAHVRSAIFVKHNTQAGYDKRRLRYWFDDLHATPRLVELPHTESHGYAVGLPTDKLSYGLHTLYMQYEGAGGSPSPVRSALFLKAPSLSDGAGIKSIRYWFDDQTEATRHYDFEHPLVAGSELTLDLDATGLMRGEHTLHAVLVDENGISGDVQSLKFVEERGIPSEVYLRRLSPDPNELVPSKLMEGALAYFHYQVTDSKEKDAKGVAGVSIKYEVLVGDKVEQRETDASDVNGVVSLPISTGVPLLSIGKRIQHRCTSAKVALGNQEIQLSQIDIEPLVLTVIPLRSNELEIGFGLHGKAKAKLGSGGIGSATASIGASASAGVKMTFRMERDVEDVITNVGFSGELSGKLGLKAEGNLGDNKISLGLGGKVLVGADISGEPSKELTFTAASAFIIANAPNVFVKTAALIGVNALKDYLENDYSWDFRKVKVTPRTSYGFEIESGIEFGGGNKLGRFKDKISSVGLSGSVDMSWTKSLVYNLRGDLVGSREGRKFGAELALDTQKFKNQISQKWKTYAKRSGMTRTLTSSDMQKIGIGLSHSTTYDQIGLNTSIYKSLEMSNSFSYIQEYKLTEKFKRYLKKLADMGGEFEVSFAKESKCKFEAGSYFSHHIDRNQRKLKYLFPQLNDGGTTTLVDQAALFLDDRQIEGELKALSDGIDVSFSDLKNDFKQTREFVQEFASQIDVPIYASPAPISWSVSVGGALDFGITYPAGESYWSTKYKRMFPTYESMYYYLPLDVLLMGPQVESWAETFISNIKRAFEPEMPKVEYKARYLCPQSHHKILQGQPFEFWTQPRFYSSGLSRIQTLRASKQEHISEFKFDFGADCLPDGAQATFYQFYPGGDLMGFAGQEEIIILSDFCSIGATHNGEALKETSQPFKIRASIGADDLKLLNFAPNTSVHLFYSAKDDGQWVDLGGIDKPIEAKGLGIYALAAKMEADEIAPELSLRLDKEHKMIVVEARENVAIRPKSVRAQINLKPVDIQLLSNKSYAIPLSEEQLMSESVLVFVEMSDLAGNRTQIIQDLPVNKTSAKESVSRLEAKLYPTQTRTVLWLETPAEFLGCPVRIYDASGATHRELVVRETTTKLDVSDLPAGNYWLRVGAETHRFVKQE